MPFLFVLEKKRNFRANPNEARARITSRAKRGEQAERSEACYTTEQREAKPFGQAGTERSCSPRSAGLRPQRSLKPSRPEQACHSKSGLLYEGPQALCKCWPALNEWVAGPKRPGWPLFLSQLKTRLYEFPSNCSKCSRTIRTFSFNFTFNMTNATTNLSNKATWVCTSLAMRVRSFCHSNSQCP